MNMNVLNIYICTSRPSHIFLWLRYITMVAKFQIAIALDTMQKHAKLLIFLKTHKLAIF